MLTTKGTALAQLAKNNRALVETLSKDQDELRDKTDAELRRLQYDVYQPKIHALNEECQALLNKVKEAAVKVHNLKVEQIKDLMAPVNQVERILEFFRSDTKQDLKTTDEIVSYPDRYKDRYRQIPTGAIGLYTYYQRVAQGLRQLMCGARKFALEHISRDDIAALTPRAAEISGITLVSDADREEVEQILRAA